MIIKFLRNENCYFDHAPGWANSFFKNLILKPGFRLIAIFNPTHMRDYRIFWIVHTHTHLTSLVLALILTYILSSALTEF